MRIKHYATILNQPGEARMVFDNQILSKDKIIKVFLNRKILCFKLLNFANASKVI